MKDFPVTSPPDIEFATKLLHLRFSTLRIEQFSMALSPLNDEEFVERFQSLPLKMHRYLYNGILSNAGQYRNERDPGGGGIYFGPQQKYRGHVPHNISSAVKKVCSKLCRNTENPASSVVNFYQEFVYLHPFYDANGRIGRFLTTLYLDYQGYHISWKRMHKNQKWLKKLNKCHDTMGGDRYEFYFDLLMKHWEKCIYLKADIAPPSGEE